MKVENRQSIMHIAKLTPIKLFQLTPPLFSIEFFFAVDIIYVHHLLYALLLLDRLQSSRMPQSYILLFCP